MLQGAKSLTSQSQGETGGHLWTTLGDSHQERGLQVHREESMRKQVGMW